MESISGGMRGKRQILANAVTRPLDTVQRIILVCMVLPFSGAAVKAWILSQYGWWPGEWQWIRLLFIPLVAFVVYGLVREVQLMEPQTAVPLSIGNWRRASGLNVRSELAAARAGLTLEVSAGDRPIPGCSVRIVGIEVNGQPRTTAAPMPRSLWPASAEGDAKGAVLHPRQPILAALQMRARQTKREFLALPLGVDGYTTLLEGAKQCILSVMATAEGRDSAECQIRVFIQDRKLAWEVLPSAESEPKPRFSLFRRGRA